MRYIKFFCAVILFPILIASYIMGAVATILISVGLAVATKKTALEWEKIVWSKVGGFLDKLWGIKKK